MVPSCGERQSRADPRSYENGVVMEQRYGEKMARRQTARPNPTLSALGVGGGKWLQAQSVQDDLRQCVRESAAMVVRVFSVRLASSPSG